MHSSGISTISAYDYSLGMLLILTSYPAYALRTITGVAVPWVESEGKNQQHVDVKGVITLRRLVETSYLLQQIGRITAGYIVYILCTFYCSHMRC